MEHAEVERAAVRGWRRQNRELMRSMVMRRGRMRGLAMCQRLRQGHAGEAHAHTAADVGRMAPDGESLMSCSPLGVLESLQLLLHLFHTRCRPDRIVYASVISFCALLAPGLVGGAFLSSARV